MGAVWRARHQSLGSEVAIKQIEPRFLDTPQAEARFLREGRTVAALKTPHVVQVFDHGIDGGVPYIVMELLHGESLAERLDRVGSLTPAETVRVILHVARALTRAHEAGVVHRDLKPDNVFLVHNDDEEIAKVIDFGIAKLSHAGEEKASVHTASGALLGTPYYMSPEQARGRPVDHRTDLWALAVIAFECLTGRRPFLGETTGDVIVGICSDPVPVPSSHATVPLGFDAWFLRGVQRDPSLRFQSAKEQASAIRELASPRGPEEIASPSLPAWRALSGAETLPAPSGESASAPTLPDEREGVAAKSGPSPATLAGLQSQAGARDAGSGALRSAPAGSWLRGPRRTAALVGTGVLLAGVFVAVARRPSRIASEPSTDSTGHPPAPASLAAPASARQTPSVEPLASPPSQPASASPVGAASSKPKGAKPSQGQAARSANVHVPSSAPAAAPEPPPKKRDPLAF